MTKSDIKSLKDVNEKRYSTWEDKIDDATVAATITKFQEIFHSSISSRRKRLRKLSDCEPISMTSIISYEGWGYVNARLQNVDVKLFYSKILCQS